VAEGGADPWAADRPLRTEGGPGTDGGSGTDGAPGRDREAVA
jgi:hypothetical protein